MENLLNDANTFYTLLYYDFLQDKAYQIISKQKEKNYFSWLFSDYLNTIQKLPLRHLIFLVKNIIPANYSHPKRSQMTVNNARL